MVAQFTNLSEDARNVLIILVGVENPGQNGSSRVSIYMDPDGFPAHFPTNVAYRAH